MTQLGDSWRTQKALLHLVAAGCPLQLAIQPLRRGPGQHRHIPHGPEGQGVRSQTSPGTRSGNAWGLGLMGEFKRASRLSPPLLGNTLGHPERRKGAPQMQKGSTWSPALAHHWLCGLGQVPRPSWASNVCICKMKPWAPSTKYVRTACSVPGVGRPDE